MFKNITVVLMTQFLCEVDKHDKISEQDQEMPQSHTADRPTTP